MGLSWYGNEFSLENFNKWYTKLWSNKNKDENSKNSFVWKFKIAIIL